MKETLILGLKMRKNTQIKVIQSAKVIEGVSECLLLKNITSVLDPPAQGTRGTPKMAVNVYLTDADKSHTLHSRK